MTTIRSTVCPNPVVGVIEKQTTKDDRRPRKICAAGSSGENKGRPDLLQAVFQLRLFRPLHIFGVERESEGDSGSLAIGLNTHLSAQG